MTEKEELDLRAALTGDQTTYRINWLVEAGAGAGKTHLIVERMVNQLTSGFCAPNQLVAITFTNKATNQLRNRLTNALLDRRNRAAGDELTRLEEVLRRMDEIQISTIHSFCQRLLREMPLETGLPFSFTLQDEEETRRYRTRFFNACCRDHADWFADAQALGIRPSSLLDSFLGLLACGDEEVVCLDDADRRTMEAEAVRLAETMRRDWTGDFSAAWPSGWRSPMLDQLLSYPPITCFQQVPGWFQLVQQFVGMKQSTGTKCSLSIIKSDGKTEKFDIQLVAAAQEQRHLTDCCEDFHKAYDELKNARKALEKKQKAKFPDEEAISKAEEELEERALEVKQHNTKPEYLFVVACYHLLKKRKEALKTPTVEFEELKRIISELLHAVVIRTLLRCRQAMNADMTARGLVSYDDLLRHTRNMLRNSPAARAHFAAQQFIVYVDEFQDTDPIQAQMLFYLSAAPDGFRNDWTRCVLRPGSLFLVGDPKQSIYRFRRADIEVYNRVRDRFDQLAPTCKVARLQFNFRSTPDLCQYATDVFSSKMQGGPGQATFLPMQSRRPGVTGAPVYQLQNASPVTTPEGLAAWIAQAVAGQHARFQDFLILCYTKKQVEDYRLALRQRGLPVNATGNHALSDTVPITRCADWCNFLLHPRSSVAAVQLLVRAGFSPAVLYTLQQKTGQSLDDLLKTRADSLHAMLPDLSEELRPALQMILRMQILRALSRTLPPVTLLEELFHGDYGLWDGNPGSEEYGWVCEYLAQLRQWPDQGLEGLLNKAIRLADSQAEYPMAYQNDADEIQLMNLHKAKGLEGRIVILAPGVHKSRTPTQHLQDGKCWFCPSFTLDVPGGSGTFFTATPPGWAQACQQEQTAAKAERLRLLYVAATRAGELLIIGHQAGSRGMQDAWAELDGGCELTQETQNVLPGLSAAALFAPETVTTTPVTADFTLPGAADDAALKQALHHLPASSRLAITPSRLDHPAPPARTLQESDESVVLQTGAPVVSLPADEKTAVPHGSDWGTIVHRTMELAVNASVWDGPALERLAGQAIQETLPDTALTKAQCRQLLGRDTAPGRAEMLAALTRTAADACAPLLREGSALRTLLQKGCALAEFPFYLSLSDASDPLYRHIRDNLAKDTPDGRPIDLNGVLDLAVQGPHGWTVVDYKTDCLQPGESDAAYADRLRAAYTPQIRTYGMILQRLTGCSVQLFLCAVPLQGQLVSLSF